MCVREEKSKALCGKVKDATNCSDLQMMDAVWFSVVNVGLAKSTCIPGLEDILKFLEIQMSCLPAALAENPLPENAAASL